MRPLVASKSRIFTRCENFDLLQEFACLLITWNERSEKRIFPVSAAIFVTNNHS